MSYLLRKNLLIYHQEGGVKKYQETISDNDTIKSSKVSITGNIKASSLCPLHLSSKLVWGKCSQFKSSNQVHTGFLLLICLLVWMNLNTTGPQQTHKPIFSDGITTFATLASKFSMFWPNLVRSQSL